MLESFFRMPKKPNSPERNNRLKYPKKSQSRHESIPGLFAENDNSYGYEGRDDENLRLSSDESDIPSDPDEGHRMATAILVDRRAQETLDNISAPTGNDVIENNGEDNKKKDNSDEILEDMAEDHIDASRINGRK